MRIFVFIPLLPFTYCLDILVYLSLVGKSHVDFVAALIDVLVERGHNVDYVIARLNSGVNWEGTSRARNVSSFGFPGDDSPWMHMDHLKDPFQQSTHFDFVKFYGIQNQLCKIGIEAGLPLEFMKAGKYDAAIVSDYDYCGAILAKAAGIPTVMAYTATNIMHAQTLHVGLPNPVSCVAANFDAVDGSFSLLAKIKRMWYDGRFLLWDRPAALNEQTKLARSVYGNHFPSTDELIQNYDLVFINSNEIIERPRTLSHKVRYIGGVALRSPKPVTEEFERLLAIPSKGVVIFSFGTQVPSDRVNFKVKLALKQAFKEYYNYTFLWKHEPQIGDEEMFREVKNLHMVKWLPQNDILGHKRVVAFITHAGLNSFLEAAYSGVPVICIPLFADQGHNTRSMVRLGMGVELDKMQLRGETLSAALQQVLEEKSFAQNAHVISKMMRSKPHKARETFAEWVEFAATNPGLHKVMNLPEVGMNVFTYYCVDVVIVIMMAFFLGCISLKFICKSIFNGVNVVIIKKQKVL